MSEEKVFRKFSGTVNHKCDFCRGIISSGYMGVGLVLCQACAEKKPSEV